jgi:hypothetical protein
MRRFQIAHDPRYGPRTGIPAIAKIENEARVAKYVTAESGCGNILPAKEIFNLSK